MPSFSMSTPDTARHMELYGCLSAHPFPLWVSIQRYFTNPVHVSSRVRCPAPQRSAASLVCSIPYHGPVLATEDDPMVSNLGQRSSEGSSGRRCCLVKESGAETMEESSDSGDHGQQTKPLASENPLPAYPMQPSHSGHDILGCYVDPLSHPPLYFYRSHSIATLLVHPSRGEVPSPRWRCRSGLGCHEQGRIRYQMAMPMGLAGSGGECHPMTASPYNAAANGLCGQLVRPLIRPSCAKGGGVERQGEVVHQLLARGVVQYSAWSPLIL